MPKQQRAPADRYITGRLLVSTPAMPDSRFRESVIYVCSHGPGGAMGLIVNKPIDNFEMGELFGQLGIESGEGSDRRTPVMFGGPVETKRGFVLHSDDYKSADTVEFAGGVALTASLDILRDMAKGTGPKRSVMALGHSGWGEGQLDEELRRDNAWAVLDAEPDLVFGEDHDAKWTRAMGRMGLRLDPTAFANIVGRA